MGLVTQLRRNASRSWERYVVTLFSPDSLFRLPRLRNDANWQNRPLESFWWMTNPLDFGPGRFERSDRRRLGFAICAEGKAPTL